ncbi:hypothetical protein [Siccirubricoccus sp. G192]|uniref:hypothetical protein n=1 Tax=Siccirubricoccus sp. G192 TaxID=2849651 RepID=UPI002811B1F4|nr:hypothetical protein [Siccirubricoccus sp. G192]
MIGGAGNDRYIGGAGNDLLTGGAGNDIFVFGAGFGHDQVTAFDSNPAGGQDLLDISALGITEATFAGVSVVQAGADTLITIAGNSITLVGVGASTITASDFILAA